MKQWLIEVRQGSAAFAVAKPVADLLCESGDDEALAGQEMLKAIYDLKLITANPPCYKISKLDWFPDDYINAAPNWIGDNSKVWLWKRTTLS
jgi:hypothetical protein